MSVEVKLNEVIFKLHVAMQENKHCVIKQVGWYYFVPLVHPLPRVTALSSTPHILHHFAKQLAELFY